MSILSKLTMAFASLAVVGSLSLSAPALAQDAFNSLGDTGAQANNNRITGTQTQQGGAGAAPQLQGATNGTIASQGA
ncbi:MAG: hypothetical protein JSS83_28505, partial [Cyanobacteria bacterium SZAS LIN-3]|nr:hypothetical protein [Cyanobacteria bacterium SZAS LIN-3]